jgi:ABC-type transport system involved in Fe-S cluster assembly fused permease/ATPase subunit
MIGQQLSLLIEDKETPPDNPAPARRLSTHYRGILDEDRARANALRLIITGHSGSGKTTLTNLVCRFYDPTEGRISLDGVDLRDIEVDSYRRLLGIVEQDAVPIEQIFEQVDDGKARVLDRHLSEVGPHVGAVAVDEVVEHSAHGFLLVMGGPYEHRGLSHAKNSDGSLQFMVTPSRQVRPM